MNKAWRVISTIVLAALLLGMISALVGVVTGADYLRIYSVLDNRFQINSWLEYFTQLYNVIYNVAISLF